MKLIELLGKKFKGFSRYDWWALGLAVGFGLLLFGLNSRHYTTFNLYGADAATFSHSMWNTVNGGEFLYSTVIGRSVLGFHFTPLFAFLSPLLLLWEDIRILFGAQIVAIVATGMILYRLVADKHPQLAPLFLLAFYLNPTLHDVAMNELRRVPLAMPFLALALYGLWQQKRGLTLGALLIALLCKEDIGIIVFMVGIYLLLWERDVKWGLGYAGLGMLWVIVIPNVVIPMLAPATVTDYPQLSYFADWGNSPQEMVITVLTQPELVMETLLERERFLALARVLLSLGIVLPFLAPKWSLIGWPMVGLFLLSSYEEMYRLKEWYMAPVLPILFFAIGVRIHNWGERRARWGVGLLLGTTLIGFGLFSQIPPGGLAKWSDYRVTAHHERASEVIALVPDEAAVGTQAAFLAPLSYRRELYLHPWYEEDVVPDYYMLDTVLNTYPLNEDEVVFERNNLVADANNVVVAEVGSIFLIEVGGEQLPSVSVEAVAEEAIKLERFEVAVMDEEGWYQPVAKDEVELKRGEVVRVSLYWEALDYVEGERTVSVRVQDSGGRLVGQKDMWPSNAARPTSWWEPGWYFRDVYYVTIAEDANVGEGSLDIMLYDSYSLEPVLLDGEEMLSLLPVVIE
ncbi:MAG TPA: DUF2079 domain-containing protein [Anaerolineae bacterium]|nr:DUF2079 domain-containing protein [Anaerolineae bacterium]